LRHRKLRQAITDIEKATQEGKIRDAFSIRQTLLQDYPGLADHPDLIAKVQQIGERERDLVEVRQSEMTAATDDQAATAPKIVLYGRSGPGLEGVTDESLVVLVNGAVYGLDASTGKVNWRRFVGYDASQPQLIGSGAEADALLSDSNRQEVLRVNAKTGNLVWRLAVKEPFQSPVMWRDRVLVTTQSGIIINVDQTTGFSRRQTNLAQPLTVSVGCGDRYPICYQIGENDHVYAVSIDSMECREVYYLGHKPGTIVAPPVVAVGHLFITENVGPDQAVVHVLKLDENGLTLTNVQDPIQLRGQVQRAPFVITRRLVFTTNLGAITILDVNPQQTPPVSAEIRPLPASYTEPVVPYAFVEEGLLWIGDSRLTAYEVQAANAQLVRKWVAYEGSSFVGPMQHIGNALIQIRRDANAPGFRVAAIDGETGQTNFWQVELGFPVLDVQSKDNGLVAFSSLGAAVNISPDQINAGIAEAPTDTRLKGASFEQALPLSANRYAFFSNSGQMLVYDPAQAGKDMRLVRLNIPAGSVATPAIVLNDGILVPLLNGQVALLNPMTGNNLVLPFEPKGRAGAQVQWRKPALVGAEQRDFVVADDQQKLYRVGIVDTGGAHLDSLETPVALEEPVYGQLASMGDTVFATLRRGDGDVIVFFGLPRLREEGALPLKSPLAWGPQRVGELVLVATEADGLIALNQSRQQVWTSPLPYGPLSGAPVTVDGDLICASQSGVVWRINGTNGQEVAKHEIGEPLGGSPVVGSGSIWVPGPDGTVYRVPLLTQ